MARPRVLLTGFGPFPGVAENPSGWLAETLAARPQSGWELHSHVFPTEWTAVGALAQDLHERLQPDVMIHFGVSPRSKGLQIERAAHNAAEQRADACGLKPECLAVAPDGADRLATRLPVAELAAHLRERGHPARTSHDCGRYLCNYLYYRSLAWAHEKDRDALFVHVPLTHAQGGPLHEVALLDAARDTLCFVLDTVPASRIERSARPGVLPREIAP